MQEEEIARTLRKIVKKNADFYQKSTGNYKKRTLFTKKSQKITKNTRFFDAFARRIYHFATNQRLNLHTELSGGGGIFIRRLYGERNPSFCTIVLSKTCPDRS
jgi:hypothetical protein